VLKLISVYSLLFNPRAFQSEFVVPISGCKSVLICPAGVNVSATVGVENLYSRQQKRVLFFSKAVKKLQLVVTKSSLYASLGAAPVPNKSSKALSGV
jgi:hypothetical protein